MKRPISSAWSKLFLVGAVVSVLVPTLTPAPPYSGSTPPFCLVCGEQGGADVIANTVLFIPLGIALALQHWRVTTQLFFAAGLTLLIESAQTTLIPGRDASLSDLVFNTLGAAVGIGLVKSFRLWLTPSLGQARWLQIFAGLFTGAAMFAMAALTQPDLQAPRYRSQWTQEVTGYDTFGGTLDEVNLGAVSLPQGRLEKPNILSDSIDAGVFMTLVGTAGPPTEGYAAIYTIRAQRNEEIWGVAQGGDDLIFRYRPLAAKFRLRQPWHELSDILSTYAPGDDLVLGIQRSAPGFNVVLNGVKHYATFRPRDGWRLILPTFASPWIHTFSTYAWMACLFFPFGLWMTRSWPTVVGAAIIGLAMGVVVATHILGPPGAIDIVGAAIGLAAGVTLRRLAAHHLAPSFDPTSRQTIGQSA